MAEALGLASSIVALVQLSASVYSATSKFYREAKEARSKISALLTQTRNLSGVLQDLSLMISSPVFDDAGVSIPEFRDTYIESCYSTLNRIKRKLEKADADFEAGSHKKLISRSLKWPFASQETDDLITELGQHRDVLHLALSADTMSHLLQCLANTNRITKSVEVLNRRLERKENIDARADLTAKREKTIQSFLKVNPEGQLQECRRQRQPNTGKWLIERDETFRNWISCPGSRVWLSGIPGAGKTILCGAVVNEILQEQTPSTAVAFFFCDYNHPDSLNPVNVVAALAVQLATQADAAFEVLDTYHEELHPHTGIQRPPDTKGMTEVVQKMISHYERVYIAVDGLDECGSNVAELLHSLKQLARGSQVSMALFSRDEAEIREELSDDLCIEIAAHTEDLELYVLAQMETRKRLGSLAVRNPELHEHIRHTLIEGANGMFRWVACQLDYLNGLPSDRRCRKALAELPPTLFETYDRILDRIIQKDEHDQKLCRKALHWIGLSYTNLDPTALCEAISIPEDEDIVDKELLVDPDWVSRSCSSLIRLVGQSSNEPHFQLAHFTVKEYLRSIKPQSNRGPFQFSEDEARLELMGTSLRFLNFPTFDRTPTVATSEIQRMAQRNKQHPFYAFAAGQIFDDNHFGLLPLCLEEEAMMQYAKKLFSPKKKAAFLSWLLEVIWNWPGFTLDEEDFSAIFALLIAPGFSTLHVAATLALPSVCKHLIVTEKVDLNICCRRGTPLHALLAGVNILSPGLFKYKRDDHHRPSLSKPRVYDQLQQCLETFIQHGADTSIRWDTASVFQMAINSSVRTVHKQSWIEPLIVPSTVVYEDCILHFKAELAAGSIHRSILDAIVTLGSNMEVASGWARLASLIQTKRMEEADYQEGEIPLELQRRLSDEDFIDGLRISLEQDLTDTLRILVQDSRFRPDIYLPCGNSQSMPILQFAIEPGNLRSVELLLEAGCDPNVVDEDNGFTSLHVCAFNVTYDAAITTLLLKSGVVDSVKTNSGSTCWHIAAEEGNVSGLKVLLDLGSDTNQLLETTSRKGRTPLAEAMRNHQVESALLLLEHCGTGFEAFQSDTSLLDLAAAIGSADLFQRLHEKLKQAGATTALQGAMPLDHIDMMCSPKLLDYLLDSWIAGSTKNSHVLEGYLLDINSDIFGDPNKYPRRDDMVHIIRRLLPAIHCGDDSDGSAPEHFWNRFCEGVVPHLTEACDHQQHQCRTGLVSMIFEILIEVGVLDSYDCAAHVPNYRLLFEALVNRGDQLQCSWIAPSVQRVLEANDLRVDLSNEAVAGALLSHAIRHPNIDLVRHLLDHGVDAHAYHDLLSPIEQACDDSDVEMFDLIIGYSDKTLINRAGSQGKALLHWAVSGTTPGYLGKIERLLELGANIDLRADNPNMDTALTLASRNDREDIFALLVSKGADSLQRGSDGWSVLHAAAATGDLRYIRSLLPARPSDSFWMGTCQYGLFRVGGKAGITHNVTAIHIAAAKGTSNFLRFLAQNHVPIDINALTGHPAFTPLHVASLYGHLEVVEFLISAKADVNARDGNALLAIDHAARHGHLGVFKTLLKSGSEKPLARHSDSIKHLMSKDVENMEDAGDSKHMSQFHFERAVIRGNLKHCKALVAKGQSINTELLTTSYTPLVCAMVEEQTEIVEWLVSVGVEVANPEIETLHPSLRCIASLATHYIPTAQTLAEVLTLALEQNANWYGSILGPLHVAVLDYKVERLEVILKHIRENKQAYRRLIETEMISVPAGIVGWQDRSALSILTSTFNREETWSNDSPWGEKMPCGSPLHWAIRKSDVSAVRLLLQNEPELNQLDSSGMTPLSLAVLSKYPAKLVRQLLQAGAGLAEPSESRIATMSSAIHEGDLEVVKILAEADPETLKHVCQYFADRDLYDAGSTEVFQYLVSQGSDPSRVLEYRVSATTFHMQPRSSSRGFIFNSGLASQSHEESLAFVPVNLALGGNRGRITLVKWLRCVLAIGLFARIMNRTSESIASPLCTAASINAVGMVEALINMGAELDLGGCRYGSPLMAACAWGCLDVVKYLVRSGALLCYVNEDGLLCSAVSLSCRHEKIKRWLLVDRHTEQRKLHYQPSQSTSRQAVWSGSRLFKLALPAYIRRDFGESRWSHLQRLEKWKKDLLGSTLAESRRDSGLDFDADGEAELRKHDAQVAHRRFVASLREH